MMKTNQSERSSEWCGARVGWTTHHRQPPLPSIFLSSLRTHRIWLSLSLCLPPFVSRLFTPSRRTPLLDSVSMRRGLIQSGRLNAKFTHSGWHVRVLPACPTHISKSAINLDREVLRFQLFVFYISISSSRRGWIWKLCPNQSYGSSD